MDISQRIKDLIAKQNEAVRLREQLDLNCDLFAKHFAQYPVGSTIDAKVSSSGKPCRAIVNGHHVDVRDDGVVITHECKKLNKDESVSNVDAYVFQSIHL